MVVVTVCSAGISEETPAPKDDSFPIGTLIVFLFSRDDLASSRSSSVTSDIFPDSSRILISSLFVFIVFSIILPHHSSITLHLMCYYLNFKSYDDGLSILIVQKR